MNLKNRCLILLGIWAVMLFSGLAVGNDERQSQAAATVGIDEISLEFEVRKELANDGDPKLQLQVFLFFQDNEPLLQDKTREALAQLRKSASAGLAEAEYTLGIVYFDGVITPQSLDRSTEWLTRAANQGHVRAKYRAGDVRYRTYMSAGDGRAKEAAFSDAERWWREVSDDRSVEKELNQLARYRLAMAYSGRLLTDERTWETLFDLANEGYQPAIESIGYLREVLAEVLGEGYSEVQPTIDRIDRFLDSRDGERPIETSGEIE
jgi:TPR repeat protein